MVSGGESSEGNAIVDVLTREKRARGGVKKEGARVVRGVYLTMYKRVRRWARMKARVSKAKRERRLIVTRGAVALVVYQVPRQPREPTRSSPVSTMKS